MSVRRPSREELIETIQYTSALASYHRGSDRCKRCVDKNLVYCDRDGSKRKKVDKSCGVCRSIQHDCVGPPAPRGRGSKVGQGGVTPEAWTAMQKEVAEIWAQMNTQLQKLIIINKELNSHDKDLESHENEIIGLNQWTNGCCDDLFCLEKDIWRIEDRTLGALQRVDKAQKEEIEGLEARLEMQGQQIKALELTVSLLKGQNHTNCLDA